MEEILNIAIALKGYEATNKQIKTLEKNRDKYKAFINTYLKDNNLTNVNEGDYYAKLSTVNKSTIDCEKLLDRLKDIANTTEDEDLCECILGECIKTVETVDEQAVETLIYEEIIPADTLQDCVKISSYNRLSIGKKKPKKEAE